MSKKYYGVRYQENNNINLKGDKGREDKSQSNNNKRGRKLVNKKLVSKPIRDYKTPHNLVINSSTMDTVFRILVFSTNTINASKQCFILESILEKIGKFVDKEILLDFVGYLHKYELEWCIKHYLQHAATWNDSKEKFLITPKHQQFLLKV